MREQNHPLVSIIIPVYNGANYMREAIDSAIAQTYDNIEIIVINDGSTDNGETEQIALSYGDKIKYFRKENGGCASALNYGIEKMSGEFFSWLSHDDVYMPHKVANAIQAYIDHDLDCQNTVIMCKSSIINENGSVIRDSFSKTNGMFVPNDMFDRLLSYGNINGCSLLIPKKIIDTIGPFSTDYVYILDYRYWFYITLNGFNYFETTDCSVKNRRHKNQVSVKKSHLHKKELNLFFREIAEFLKDDTTRCRKLWLRCYRTGLKEACRDIKKSTKIPLSLRIKAVIKRLLHILFTLAKQIYRRIYGIS